MKLLSVVLPAYNEENMIKKAGTVIGQILDAQNIPYEIVFVDDGPGQRLSGQRKKIHILPECTFPEILEKNPLCWQDLQMQRETAV